VEQLRGGPANQLHATLRSLEQASKELNASVAALRSDAERTHALTATQNDAVQLAESTIKASGEAAAQLSAASQELRSTMSGQVAERQQSLNHSVDRLSDAAKSLEGFFANDIGRLSDKVSRLDESVGELSQSMEQLDRLQKLEKHLSSLEGSLTGLGEKLDALQSLPKDLAAALQHGNGIPYPNSNGGLPVESPTPTKSWFKGT
jgi:DNA anti-recombination protein RmuC